VGSKSVCLKLSLRMASTKSKDWFRLELDVTQETNNFIVKRKPGRKIKEYAASEVTFYRNVLTTLIMCSNVKCWGHVQFGWIADENVPVIFRRHDEEKDGIYAPFRSKICLPLRMPEDGDSILSGIRWRVQNSTLTTILMAAQSTIVDCLAANLKFRMLTKEFCLECLMVHRNGIGLQFERLLKTLLFHLIFYGRSGEKGPYTAIQKYSKMLDMKIRRIWWGPTDRIFKYVSIDSNAKLREALVYSPDTWMVDGVGWGVNVDPNQGILRWLNTVSEILVTVKCGCNSGASVSRKVYIGLLRKNRRSDLYSIVLAKWNLEGVEYEDPLWNFSLFGPNRGSTVVTGIKTEPLTGECKKCKVQLNIYNITVPETTWLFMADLSAELQKGSVDGLKKISTYTLGGVVFYLAFVLLYNSETGHFTSMNTYEMWRFFDDSCGGLFKYCNPNNVKYQNRWNLRAFYYRKVEGNVHRCLVKAEEYYDCDWDSK